MELRPISGERDLWARWQTGQLPGGLRTRDGLAVRVLFPGQLNSGPGPDFTNALLQFEGDAAVRGDVELHLKASSWAGHGHHQDPRYIAVILHVVLQDDGGLARTLSDVLVPVLALGPLLQAPRGPRPDGLAAGPCWDLHAARPTPDALGSLILEAGRARFLARARLWESEFLARTVADGMLKALLQLVGLGRNSEACTLLASALDGPTLEALLAGSGAMAEPIAGGVLLGMAGLLEVAHADDLLRQAWARHRDYWPGRPLDARQWQRFRLRPANLPEVRLRFVAAVLAAYGLQGLLDHLVTLIMREPAPPASALLASLLPPGATAGRGWLLESWANVVLPLLSGYGVAQNQTQLVDRAMVLYARLPGGGENHVLSRMCSIAGLSTVPRTAIEQQGLLQIWASHCDHQDCVRCPLATASGQQVTGS